MLVLVIKIDWKFVCCELFVVMIEVEVYEYFVWGILGIENFVEIMKFEYVVFEFGEDLFFG